MQKYLIYICDIKNNYYICIEYLKQNMMKTLIYNGTKINYTDYLAEEILSNMFEVTLSNNNDIVAVIMVNKNQLKNL